MSPRKFIRQILTSTCIFCTVISVLFFFFAAIVNEVESLFDDGASLPFRFFLLILLFSLLIALANRLFSVRKIRFIFRLLIHYATLLAAFLSTFVAFGKLKINGPASVFVAIMVFTILYAVIVGLTLAVMKFLGVPIFQSDEKEEQPAYKSRFH